MEKPSLEVAEIFRLHGEDYRKSHPPLTPVKNKAVRDIEACRTAHLGGHVDLCSSGCGYMAISYNSCRNRHCPKCQSLKQAKWFEERVQRLLPVPYFHIVVTLPHEVNPLTLSNQEFIFNLLFQATSRAILEFAPGYERLRAQVGFTAVLHTWDQDLLLHPHLHIIVTGGGLNAQGDRWISSKNTFLFPVKALSKIIRSKFVEALEKAFHQGRLKGNARCLRNSVEFKRFTRKLKRNKWVVYCKEPFGGSHQAYRYISRYTHRVAISNHRLVSLTEGNVTFRARDNHNPGQYRLVTITAQKFIHRFLTHVLPSRFVKIRHFGLMAPRNAKTKLERARALIPLAESVLSNDLTDHNLDSFEENPAKTWRDTMLEITGIDLITCPKCGKGNLVRFRLTGYGDDLYFPPAIWDSS